MLYVTHWDLRKVIQGRISDCISYVTMFNIFKYFYQMEETMQMSLKVFSDQRRLEKYAIRVKMNEYRLSVVFWNQKSSVW